MSTRRWRSYEFGPFRLNVEERLLQCVNRPMRLPPKVVDTLVALVENRGHVAGKEELMRTIWPDSFVAESSLAQNISLLRKTLAETGGNQRYIETIPKRGYRFVAKTREIIRSDGEFADGGSIRPTIYEGNHMQEPASKGNGKPKMQARLDNRWQGLPETRSATKHIRKDDFSESLSSLAVLPFANASGDVDSEYLSDGITESIINNLSQLPRLRVIARTTVFRYKGSDLDAPEIGEQLGVSAVLTGRVLHLDNIINIQAELVNVLDKSQLWGEQYTRNASDIFAVQEQIASEIAEKLRIRLSAEEKERLTKRYTENTQAYHLYLKGRYHWNKRTAESLRKGIDCFEQAIEIDPNYALAYAGKSDCYAFLGDVGISSIRPQKAFAKARQAAQEALKIDDMLAEAHLSLAHLNLHDFEWREAKQEYRRAIELNPNLACAHQWYAYYFLFQGRYEEAIEEASVGLALDPLSLSANADLGQVLYYSRQHAAGIEQFRKVVDLEPNFYRHHLWLGWAYLQEGMYDEATLEFQTARTLYRGNTDALASLVCVYAQSGNKKKARSTFAELTKLSKRSFVSHYTMAWVYLSLGERDKTFASLDRACDQRAEWMPYLGVDPRFDSLRTEERFQTILRKVGLPSTPFGDLVHTPRKPRLEQKRNHWNSKGAIRKSVNTDVKTSSRNS